MEVKLCEEIKKIPFKMACQTLGVEESELSNLMQNEKNQKLIEEGFNELYYLINLGPFEPNIFTRYSSMISFEGSSSNSSSNFNRELMVNYQKLVKFCMSPRTGRTIAKSDVERFANAAQEFALFGKLEPEDEEIMHETVFRTKETNLNFAKTQSHSKISRVVRNIPRSAGNSNVILLNPQHVLMPIFYKPVPILCPLIPHFRPQFPVNSRQWLTRVGEFHANKNSRSAHLLPVRPASNQSSTLKTNDLKQALKLAAIDKKEKSEEKEAE